MIKESDYSIIFIDVNMPDMDGFELLGEIRKYYSKLNKEMPYVIMVSGQHINSFVEKSREYGAYTTMSKPYDFEELVNLIEQIKNTKD